LRAAGTFSPLTRVGMICKRFRLQRVHLFHDLFEFVSQVQPPSLEFLELCSH